MSQCNICGKSNDDDLFAYVTGERVCSVCKVRFIGGLPTTERRIDAARERLELKPGEFLKQDNAEEARKILRQ